MVTIETIQSVNYLVSIGGIIAIVAGALLAYDMYTTQRAGAFIRSFGLYIAGTVALVATILTLIYSEVFGVIPCGLCWLERIMLYPQVFLIATALYYKDRLVARYGIVLSGAGLIISLYHHYIQMGGSQFIKCPAVGAGADCAKRFLFEFGFITFPLLAGILFAFLIVVYLYILKTQQKAFQLSE